jgi:hypothetical protein
VKCKYDSRCNLNKIHYFDGPNKHSSISANYCHIIVTLNLKFHPDKFKINEEKAIIVYFAVLAGWVSFHNSPRIIHHKK